MAKYKFCHLYPESISNCDMLSLIVWQHLNFFCWALFVSAFNWRTTLKPLISSPVSLLLQRASSLRTHPLEGQDRLFLLCMTTWQALKMSSKGQSRCDRMEVKVVLKDAVSNGFFFVITLTLWPQIVTSVTQRYTSFRISHSKIENRWKSFVIFWSLNLGDLPVFPNFAKDFLKGVIVSESVPKGKFFRKSWSHWTAIFSLKDIKGMTDGRMKQYCG